MSGDKHPLLRLLLAAGRGRFPPVDGGVTMTRALDDGREAIVCFTGHAVISSRLTLDDLGQPCPDGFGGALHPRVQQLMAGEGDIGVNDVTLVAEGRGGPAELVMSDRWDDHPRVRYARRLRTDITVHGDDTGFVTIGRGLAARPEMSVEITGPIHGSGAGRSLIGRALGLVPAGQPVFAAVSPGNARSLRAFLSQGFEPLGSEVIITPG